MISYNLTNKITIYLINIILIFYTNLSFAEEKLQKISYYSIDLTEVSIGEFSKFSKTTNFITEAEKRGWGYIYAFGWVKDLI